MAHREAAYLLNTYIEGLRDLLFDPPFLTEDDLSSPPTLLELGSGTGIVAETCAARLADFDGALIVATDLPEVCPLLDQNLHQRIAGSSRPSAPKVLVRSLTWGSALEARYMATQLGYLPSSQRTISTSPQHLTHVICSDLVRLSPSKDSR